jgi:hypothetical protein
MHRWRVDLIGEKIRHIGTVKADIAEQAINEVAKLFAIESRLRDKLAATKVGTKND